MDQRRRQAVLDRVQAEGRLPSIVGASVRAGELTWSGAAGAGAGLGDHTTTQYRIGSITKTFTAVLVLQCRDDGLLDLDDPLGRFVPESGYADATVRDLLAHASGMQAEPVGPWWERSPGIAVDALLAANDGTGRVSAAGVRFHYSNLGFALLGEVVARLRDESWEDLVAGRLLAPLSMSDTSYLPRPGRHAQGYSVDHFAGTLTHEPHEETGAMAPAGQYWSTLTDLARWLDFLAAGRPGVLGAETLAEMRRPVASADYGLGLRLLEVDGILRVGHTGSMPGFLATAFVDPGSREGVVALTNATSGISTDQLARDLITGTEPSAVEAWTPSGEVRARVAELLGLWFWGNSAHELRWSNGLLELRSLAPGALEDRFTLEAERIVGVEGYLHGETLEVHRTEDGAVAYLECATFRFTRTPYADPAHGDA